MLGVFAAGMGILLVVVVVEVVWSWEQFGVLSELPALSVATHSESGAQDPRRVTALIGWFLGSEAERSAACASRQPHRGQVSQGHPDHYRKRSGAASKIRALLNSNRGVQQDTRNEHFTLLGVFDKLLTFTGA